MALDPRAASDSASLPARRLWNQAAAAFLFMQLLASRLGWHSVRPTATVDLLRGKAASSCSAASDLLVTVCSGTAAVCSSSSRRAGTARDLPNCAASAQGFTPCCCASGPSRPSAAWLLLLPDRCAAPPSACSFCPAAAANPAARNLELIRQSHLAAQASCSRRLVKVGTSTEGVQALAGSMCRRHLFGV